MRNSIVVSGAMKYKPRRLFFNEGHGKEDPLSKSQFLA